MRSFLLWFLKVTLLINYGLAVFTPAGTILPSAISNCTAAVVGDKIVVAGGVTLFCDHNCVIYANCIFFVCFKCCKDEVYYRLFFLKNMFGTSTFSLNLSSVTSQNSVSPGLLEWTEVSLNQSDPMYGVTFRGQVSATANGVVYAYDEESGTFFIYDSANGSWTQSSSSGNQLSAPCVAFDSDQNKATVFGTKNASSYLLEYDPSTDAWSSLFGKLNNDGSFFSLLSPQCAIYSNAVVIFGGMSQSSGVVSEDVYVYNTLQWTKSSKMTVEQQYPKKKKKKIFFLKKKLSNFDTHTVASFHSLATAEIFDLSTVTYLGFAPSLFLSRDSFGLAFDATRKILFAVGGQQSGQALSEWEYLDLRTTAVSGLPISCACAFFL
ncbi:hypothetical protein RFI_04434 [Reticulomyxa filosa]|uniref:Kelch repeat protein n=1 Tax=Reticulomyxa filosa TaxID=46433 RepID=X6P3H9_RETFI|nr:hypothetical protein RFI_04434 [Reticulomyxa filosa]|eukprot:ETO32683.1 hypothetical protein RFI_04434 [Reticulomyxa filosa]